MIGLHLRSVRLFFQAKDKNVGCVVGVLPLTSVEPGVFVLWVKNYLAAVDSTSQMHVFRLAHA